MTVFTELACRVLDQMVTVTDKLKLMERLFDVHYTLAVGRHPRSIVCHIAEYRR